MIENWQVTFMNGKRTEEKERSGGINENNHKSSLLTKRSRKQGPETECQQNFLAIHAKNAELIP